MSMGPHVNVRISTDLLASLQLRDDACNRVDIMVGEPDSDGFSDLTFTVDYDDNPLKHGAGEHPGVM